MEVLVALALLELLLLGALGTLRLASERARRAEVLERAIWAARAAADSIASGRSAGSRVTAWGVVTVEDRRVAASDSAGRELVVFEVTTP